MEVDCVRCCDTAAFVALFNMLKINLCSTPEIFNTLLAVLCDFDPNKHGNRERTWRYIRLLVSDKMLANCLFMSLPQGNTRKMRKRLDCSEDREIMSARDIQSVPRNTASLHRFKKAVKHKYGSRKWKRNVCPRQSRSEEHTDVTTSMRNQNITVIVTDQNDETEGKEVPLPDDSSCNLSTLHHLLSPKQEKASKSSPSTPTCISNSGNSQTRDVSVLRNRSVSVDSTSKPSEPVTPIQCRRKAQNMAMKDILTACTVQSHVPQTGFSTGQHPSQFVDTSKSRLVSPVVPIAYQPYTYPVQLPGNTAYQSCLTGFTTNPLLPWAPIHYISSMSPQLGPVVGFTRHSFSCEDDITLDLSVAQTSTASVQTRNTLHNGTSKVRNLKGTKRSASTSSMEHTRKIEEPKRKAARMSADMSENTGSKCILPNKGVNVNLHNLQNKSLYTAVTASSISLLENRDRKEEMQPLQALQELMLRINPQNPYDTKTTTCPSTAVRNSLSTASLTTTWTPSLSKACVVAGKSASISVTSRPATQQLYQTQDRQTVAFVNKDMSQINKLQHSTAAPYRLVPPYTRKEQVQPICIATPTYLQQTPTYSGSLSNTFKAVSPSCSRSQSNIFMPVSNALSQTQGNTLPAVSDLIGTCILNPTRCVSEPLSTTCAVYPRGSNSLRSFPYSQHIQLLDAAGKFSAIDFPAHLTQNNTLSDEKSMRCSNGNANNQETKCFNSQHEGGSPDYKTLLKSESIETDAGLKNGSMTGCLNETPLTHRDVEDINEVHVVGNKDAGRPNSQFVVSSQSKAGEMSSYKTTTPLNIQTNTDNGMEQTQINLDTQNRTSLLGELLKLKPAIVIERQSSSCLPDLCKFDTSGEVEFVATLLNLDGQFTSRIDGKETNAYRLNNNTKPAVKCQQDPCMEVKEHIQGQSASHSLKPSKVTVLSDNVLLQSIRDSFHLVDTNNKSHRESSVETEMVQSGGNERELMVLSDASGLCEPNPAMIAVPIPDANQSLQLVEPRVITIPMPDASSLPASLQLDVLSSQNSGSSESNVPDRQMVGVQNDGQSVGGVRYDEQSVDSVQYDGQSVGVQYDEQSVDVRYDAHSVDNAQYDRQFVISGVRYDTQSVDSAQYDGQLVGGVRYDKQSVDSAQYDRQSVGVRYDAQSVDSTQCHGQSVGVRYGKHSVDSAQYDGQSVDGVRFDALSVNGAQYDGQSVGVQYGKQSVDSTQYDRQSVGVRYDEQSLDSVQYKASVDYTDYVPNETYSGLSQDTQSCLIEDFQSRFNANSEPHSSISLCNVSPYLLGMLPDTTTNTDDEVFLDEYITPNVVKCMSKVVSGSSTQSDK